MPGIKAVLYAEIRELARQGVSNRELSRKFGISMSRIAQIVSTKPADDKQTSPRGIARPACPFAFTIRFPGIAWTGEFYSSLPPVLKP